MAQWIDHRAFAWLSRGLLAAVVAGLSWACAMASWADAVASAAIAAVIAAILFGWPRLPSLLAFLLAVAATVNGAGYAFKLWHDETLFDEVVHAFTSFAGMAAIGWALLQRQPQAGSHARLIANVIGIGFALGILWECFEWLIGIIGRPRDTAIDLLMDGAGILAAAVLVARLARADRPDHDAVGNRSELAE